MYTGSRISIQDWLSLTCTMLVFLVLHFRFGVCWSKGDLEFWMQWRLLDMAR